jgi:hypothetical protein
MDQILKYPRTRHIEGSKEQWGDHDLNLMSLADLKEKFLVVEEKMDGANCGINFNAQGNLILQSRGHLLSGGPREKHFSMFKTWANSFTEQLWQVLGTRYIMYGEWMYAKHTVFYDALPHYFLEFDIFDKQNLVFLSTNRRKNILKEFPFIHSVRIIHSAICFEPQKLVQMIGPSYAITHKNRENLNDEIKKQGLDPVRVFRETDLEGIMEGLYIKEENEEIVINRYKFIRGSFLSAVFNAEGHWLNRPIIPNKLINNQVMYAMG